MAQLAHGLAHLAHGLVHLTHGLAHHLALINYVGSP